MKVIPVLDIARGVAVHATGGDRSRYRPVESVLAPSPDPLVLASGFRRHLGLEELYLADLDAIGGEEPQWEIYRGLLREGFRLLVDPGVRDRHLALGLGDAGVQSVVAGLETLAGPEHIPELVEVVGARSLVLGLDLRDGAPLGDPAVWGPRATAVSIARAAHTRGVRRFLILDLALVGGEAGPPLPVAREILSTCAPAEVLVGGGVRNGDDLKALAAGGVSGVLVATALHRGEIDRATLESLEGL